VTKRIGHLFSHLDPRYINANEMVSNADLLDGQDSTAFLEANAKAADADLLDGQNSTSLAPVLTPDELSSWRPPTPQGPTLAPPLIPPESGSRASM